MLYTGIDLTSIDRIRKSTQNPRFTARVFSSEERAYFSSLKDPYPSMAAAFAAKEAFSKALGTGVRGFKLCEVSVLHTPLGAPFYSFSGAAKKEVSKRKLIFSLSLTHTDAVAAAVAVAEDMSEPTEVSSKASSIPCTRIHRRLTVQSTKGRVYPYGRSIRKNHSRRRNRRNRRL